MTETNMNEAVLAEQEVLLTDDLFTKDDTAYADADKMTRPSLTYWSDAWRRFKENKLAMVSSVILLIIIAMAIVQPTVRRRISLSIPPIPTPGVCSSPFLRKMSATASLCIPSWVPRRTSLILRWAAPSPPAAPMP